MDVFIKQTIENIQDLCNGYTRRNGFIFTSVTYPGNVFDAIVIRTDGNPLWCPRYAVSEHSLDAHIDLVNKYSLEKAIVFADSLEFLTQCPSLKHLCIVPTKNIDVQPLYELPQLKSISFNFINLEKEKFENLIDCFKFKGLLSLVVNNKALVNYEKISTLKSLSISGLKANDLIGQFNSKALDTLMLIQCGVSSLNGLEQSSELHSLYLYHNRKLSDISALSNCKKTLKKLRISSCPAIKDFSVLEVLENLELLELTGNNVLPNLDFIIKMKNLKTFTFSMVVENGDLTPCLSLQYVHSEKNRKHYNLKDKDLPKINYVRGDEGIEEWRREI